MVDGLVDRLVGRSIVIIMSSTFSLLKNAILALKCQKSLDKIDTTYKGIDILCVELSLYALDIFGVSVAFGYLQFFGRVGCSVGRLNNRSTIIILKNRELSEFHPQLAGILAKLNFSARFHHYTLLLTSKLFHVVVQYGCVE